MEESETDLGALFKTPGQFHVSRGGKIISYAKQNFISLSGLFGAEE
jgi:hypothetical protein